MLPFMRSKNQTQVYNITAFGGLNSSYSQRINEISKGLNTSSELYPALSSSGLPKVEKNFSHKCIGGGFYNKLYTLNEKDDGALYVCTEDSETNISEYSVKEASSPEKRTIGFMNDELLIIPDNVIYYTNEKTAKAGNVSANFTSTKAQAKFEAQSLSSNKMPMPYNIWYSAELTSNSIVSMSGGYKLSSTSYTYYHMGLPLSLEIGDVITLYMSVKPIDVTHDDMYDLYLKKMSNGISLKIKDLVKTSHDTPSGRITEYTEIIFEDNAMDMGGYSEVLVMGLTVKKEIPEFVDICSFENRMWGVTKDKIHASKLGDSSEWNDYSQDSYGTLPSSCFSTEVETDGDFIAVTSYNGNVIAFKEDCIHKIYGNEPDEFTVTKLDCPGVSKGSKETLVTVNGVLYYMGKNGVYAYGGSMPKLISSNVIKPGSVAAYAGGDERYYYIDIENEGIHKLYVYDTIHGIWHAIRSAEDIVSFVTMPEGEHIITSSSLLKMNSLSPDNWSFEFNIGTKEFSSKHICSVSARYSLEEGGSFAVYLINRHSTYRLAYKDAPAENKPLIVRIPVSCDRDAKLVFEGSGSFVLSSLDIQYRETGIY